MRSPINPVFTPDNEPYLGREFLKIFDLTIVSSLAVHRQLGVRTFAPDLTPLQVAAGQIIPQGISIALSMRELIRQAYLFSAGILMRPLVERTGTVYYLFENPGSVQQWHAGWPRKSQPNFGVLLDLVMPSDSGEERKSIEEMMHKLVHSDPKSADLNATTRADGLRASAAGKELHEPEKVDAISACATRCLDGLTRISVKVFGGMGE